MSRWTSRQLMVAAGTGSALLLAGAFLFQVLGYAPCKLCLWQRWPHALAILLGAVAWVRATRPVGACGALAALATAGIGAYHTGIERGWWPGPDSCTGGMDITSMSAAELLSTDGAATIVMCDEVAWSMAGLSMASWNALLSLGLAAIWLAAVLPRRPAAPSHYGESE